MIDWLKLQWKIFCNWIYHKEDILYVVDEPVQKGDNWEYTVKYLGYRTKAFNIVLKEKWFEKDDVIRGVK